MSDDYYPIAEVEPVFLAPSRRPELEDWLSTSGWVVAGADGSFGAGARALELFPGIDRFVLKLEPGERSVQTAYASAGAPECPNCASAFAPEDDWETFERLVTGWERAGEPTLTCPTCGWSGPMGDWEVLYSAVVSSTAMVLETWVDQLWAGEVAKRIRDEVSAALGGRWVVIQQHL